MEIVKTIIDNENGRKWEIIKVDEDKYTFEYYEFFSVQGWVKYKTNTDIYTKEAIEFEFDIVL